MTIEQEVCPLTFAVSDCPACPGLRTHLVLHRDWPELVGEGGTPREAVVDLFRRLDLETDTLEDEWHRAELERVLADIRSYLDRPA